MGHNARLHCGPMQAAKRKTKYAAQFARTERNRRRKRERHLALHPKDLQTLEALKKQLLAHGR